MENQRIIELLYRLKQDDVSAFEELYNFYKRPMAQRLHKLLKSEILAQDALQELFIRIWTSRAKIDDRQPFTAYLYKIAQNLVIDYYRKIAKDRNLQNAIMIEGNLQSEFNHLERKEQRQHIQRLIDKLPPQQRLAFTLHKIEGKSHQEISEIMKIGRSTVNKHIFYANQTLRKELSESMSLYTIVIICNLFQNIAI
ncbi:RNA polymerase sigma factor [Sphingobacterium hotanense]|uniref:RNA polymerase sigma factor n=1 Tax=Sphingobacterium hotanense TaxID=649196 RepID=UPI0011F210FE|nr:RNA polymerase sigma factor [Sphingobacterium hotanense]